MQSATTYRQSEMVYTIYGVIYNLSSCNWHVIKRGMKPNKRKRNYIWLIKIQQMEPAEKLLERIRAEKKNTQ